MNSGSILNYQNGRWTEREFLDLATGLQKYGSSETAKIAKFIGTKSESAVKLFLNYKMRLWKKKFMAEKYQHESTQGVCGVQLKRQIPEEMKNWPAVRKWNKIARNQITDVKESDYSKSIIQDMCRDFYEEAEEPKNPQIVDVKAIYKFILDCVCGKNPAELMPKESGIVLMLLKKLKAMKNCMDLDEEQKFILSFKEATKFVPFQMKDESSESKETVDDSDVVLIPKEVHNNLVRHRKLVQCFNPLMVPLWLIDKEQSFLFREMKLLDENDGN